MKAVVIDIDSLRPFNMGCYGYSENTTPNIDELVKDSVVFENAYAASTPTLPSHANILTGRYSVSTGIVSHYAEDQVMNRPESWSFEKKKDWNGDLSEWWGFPELLFRNEVETLAVSSLPRKPVPWFGKVWNQMVQPEGEQELDGMFSTVKAEEVADHSTGLIKENSEEDFLLYSQFWDTHVPYNSGEKFKEAKLPAYPTEEQIEEHREWDKWRSASEVEVENREDLREVVSDYNAQIKYTDRHVGRIIEELRAQGIYEETLVIVTADHGEEFGEHGLYQEHGNVYETTQRVPLIVKPPRKDSGSRKDELVTNADIAPTIADFFDLEEPGKWQGRSLKPMIEGKNPEWRSAVVLDHGLYTVQRAIRQGKWKLVKTLHPGFWNSEILEFQLFNLEEDSWEQENLSGKYPAKVEQLKEKMDAWVEANLDLEEDPLEKLAEKGPAGYSFNEDEFEGV